MDDSRKDSNKTVIKPSAIPRLLPSSSDLKQKIVTTRRESNENEEELITNHINYSSSSKLQNPKKPSTPKHFMSPTISAASKISTPKKKILMERNDFSSSETSSTTTHVSKNPNLDSKTPNSSSQIGLPPKILDFSVPPNLQSSQTTPISSKLTDSEETPYDPKTNFLSPRPKFLRFNPNRRMEILKRREEELKQQAEQSCSDEQESDDLSSSSQGDESGLSSTTSEEETITKKGPSEHAESEVEIEEEEDEEVEEEEEEEVEKNGFLWNLYQVLKFLLLVGFVGFSTSYISSMNVANLQLQPVCDVKQGFKIFENGFCPSGLEKSVLWNVSSNPELVMNKASIIKEVELEKPVEIPAQIEDEILIGMTQVSLESGGEEDDKLVLSAEEEVVEDENVKPGEVEISDQVVEDENVESVSLSNQLSEGNAEVAEQLEASEPISDEVVAEEFEAPEPISNAEVVEEFEAPEETVSNEDVASELVSYEDVTEDPEASKPVSNEVAEEVEASIPVSNEVAGEAEASRRIAKLELGVGVSVISAILASLIIVFRHLKHQRQAVNECAPTMGPPAEAFLTEEQETIIAETLEKAKKCYLPKKDEVAAESYIDSTFHSSGRVSEDLYRSRAAPSVQLLGDFIVEESGSSLRSCSVLNSKAIEDGEESKFSVSMSDMNSRGRRRGASSVMQEDVSEFSNADSYSYGRFTTQEKLTRKDGGDFTTPVRRSSRIRTKSVTSS
ncbi:hypothetical protein C5167_018538 [Papaver somniferum]|uniref:Uncharacterized protein n=1 Tax=Papaver somniferum TaxID=3469 RepID=A0A4Y7IRQ4_PAPSO|nr:uncharacterized protein LOC113348106 [Papaver somniferum]RZC50115.1 hypothetical protein C5167_018538 [Papaver somniferum]